MLMKKIVLSLMLLASTLSVFANPGQPRAEHEAVRAVRQEQAGAARNDPQAARNFQYPESNRSSEEGLKKNNKLSPEERRVLRQQINEAGQDLYTRKP